jgi:Domain of unknown function (DUF1998)
MMFYVDIANEAAVEASATNASGTLSATALRAIPVCDVDLPHSSQINDDEDYRFQLPVAVFGYEQDRHGGGSAWRWGKKEVQQRTAVQVRLVNVGAASPVRKGSLGYPICAVCGQSRSPMSSEAERENFASSHMERCRQPVEPTGFYSDIIADAVIFRSESREEAWSLAESLRKGAAEVLEMEPDDLQIVVIGRAGETAVDTMLYDPMPGGSGLLDQMITRWGEVVGASAQLLKGCASQCDCACIDCLLDYRNAWYQGHLNRHTALALIGALGEALEFSHEIPARLLATESPEIPVNAGEETLRQMLKRAGFHNFMSQQTIELGRPVGRTTPDFFFDDPNGHYEGICIYLDGLSANLHGDPAIARRDREIREALRDRFYEVLEITYAELSDCDAMKRHFFRLGRALLGRDGAERVRRDDTWFSSQEPEKLATPSPGVDIAAHDDWKECIDLLDAEWRPLATGLRDVGVPAPTEVDLEILIDGKVGDTNSRNLHPCSWQTDRDRAINRQASSI